MENRSCWMISSWEPGIHRVEGWKKVDPSREPVTQQHDSSMALLNHTGKQIRNHNCTNPQPWATVLTRTNRMDHPANIEVRYSGQIFLVTCPTDAKEQPFVDQQFGSIYSTRHKTAQSFQGFQQ
ncbi:hypothetical protein DAPPUDRAFT_246361 [Daphnia pulex]|uniref:Uncharacterized protein n=1 Tax=Daphnia pulex TaxID=6669 RepID=E9GQA4_DAPPU|nr:hypothetical protein DAPPUDRAFT_246361 [Daphnia pulex]|eukprot:EFX78377.1 hypothetical protein DAPPUDRAFT_246361 [Daphnia pulex]